MHMPQHFMGLAGREGRVESERYAAIVRRATCSHSSKAGLTRCFMWIYEAIWEV